jgi:flagellar hook-associated protein 2
VNLAGAQTLDDVIQRINDAGLGIVASYNPAGNGIALTDTTGLVASNLIVTNGDATSSATKLKIAANVAAPSVNSGSLDRQVVGRSTLLSSYNGGQGVKKGNFTITNSTGTVRSINLNLLDIQTVGDLIDKINSFGFGVKARINDAGDGIALIDTAGGSGTLTVADVGTGRAAADLHLRGSGTATTIDGQPAKLLNGTTTLSIDLDADDTLDDLVTKINELQAGATASIINTGGSLGTHLSLLSNVAGKAGELLIDGSQLGLAFGDLTGAQDALLQVGGQSAASVLLSSSSNQFKNVVEGLDVTLTGAGTSPVTITVSQSADDIAAALQTFVDQYNKLRDKLGTYTAYDPTAGTKGTLFASSETLRLDSDLARALTARYFNDGPIRSLAELGIGIDDQGKLSLDKTKLLAKFNADPQAVTDFFTDEDRGFAGKLDGILESLVGRDRSLLVTRAQTLQTQIEDAGTRIDRWNERLDRSRERLLSQFNRMESIVTSLQSSLQALNQIQVLSLAQSNNN